MMRFGAAGAFALLAGAALTACVDPKSDYDSYLARTADANTTISNGDDASFDGSSADGGFAGQNYVMACVSQITNDDITEATLFVATATFHASDTSGNGTFDFSDTALNVGAPDTTQTAGAPYPTVGSTVTGGKVDVVFGMSTIPAAADPLHQGDIVFTDTTLHMLIGPGVNLCATLSGDLQLPFVQQLTADKNTCIFVPFDGDKGTVPTFTQDQVHCP